MLKRSLALGALLAACAAPAAAQNAVEVTPPPPVATTPAPPPAAPAPPPAAPQDNVAAPREVTATSPPPEPAPREPVEIDPDAAYPNGFADPVDPLSTNLNQERPGRGFPWGLLGLLGLLGLIPLFRKGGRVSRTVYVDRDNPERVLREERVEE